MPGVKRIRPAGQSRRDQAQATQRRIVKAAYDLFCTRGYAATTMVEIAETAGVAVQTVYFAFHTKGALLSRTYDFAVMGEGERLAPQQQPWYHEMVEESDLNAALRHLVAGVGEIIRRVTPLFVVARAGAEGDPETARVMAFHETWRARGYREMVEVLQSKVPIRAGLSLERATQLLMLYVGMDVFHILVDVYGWPFEEWVEWTTATIREQIFGGLEGAGLAT